MSSASTYSVTERCLAFSYSPEPMVLPTIVSAALPTPKMSTDTNWLSTEKMLLAATKLVPMRPMTTPTIEEPSPQVSSLPMTGSDSEIYFL